MAKFPFNIIRLIERQRTRRWDRQGISFYRFENEKFSSAVYASSNGKPKLLLLHGFAASALLQWYDTARLLKHDFDLIIPDLLCSGYSVLKDGTYSVEDQVAHIKFILDELGVDEKILVCGNSYGGLIAAHFTHTYPELVDRVVLYDAPAKFYSLTYANELAVSMGMESIYKLLMPTTAFEMKKALGLIYTKLPFIPDFLYEAMFESPITDQRPCQEMLLDHLISNEKKYQDFEYIITCPIYIIWGDSDRLIPMDTALSLKEYFNVSDDRFKVVTNAAHSINMERPREFCTELKALLAI
ncbi:MAG: alpha/beta hydrolase [Flavobacteriales bacterium]